MRTQNFKAKPMSRKDIRDIVKTIKRKCGLNNVLNIPVGRFLEFMEWLLPEFNWEIVFADEMEEEGVTYSAERKIQIREDVYVAACNGDGRARFTIMHEIGHCILHGPDRVVLCRLSPGETLKYYENPEWQADNFAAEFLMDDELVGGMNYKQISRECCVSYGAAKARIDVLTKERHL